MSTLEPIRTWRMAGGDGTRRGVSNAALTLNNKSVTSIKAKGAVTASPVFTEDGRVFIADRAGLLQAFSPAGTLLWSRKLTAGVEASPAIDENCRTICIGTLNGHYSFFDVQYGRQLHSGSYETHDARILADLLYTQDPELVITSIWGKWVLFAVASTKEKPVFEWNGGWNPRAPMAALPGGPAYGIRIESDGNTKGTRLFSIDLKNGKEDTVLFLPAGDESPRRLTSFASPVVSEEILYAVMNGAHDSKLFAIDRNTKKQIWSHELPCTVSTTPALTLDRCLIVAGMDGRVYAIDKEGERRFTYSTDCEYLLASPVCDREGCVVIGDPLGRIHMVEPDGKGRNVTELPRSIEGRPAFSPDGRLFVPCTDGNLYLFE